MPKPSTMQHGAPDDFQTPDYALRPLIPYLPRNGLLWECATGNDNLTLALEQQGFSIMGTDILGMADFLDPDSIGYPANMTDAVSCIVTNPPYSLKYEFMVECHLLRKPFALLMPLTFLGTFKRQYLLDGIEIIFMGGRINFETPSGEGSGSWFETAWFTHGLNLPHQLNFPTSPIDRTPLTDTTDIIT